MSRLTLRSLVIAAVMVAWGAAFCLSAQAEGRCPRRGVTCRPYAEPYGGDLFYNHYSQGYCDRTAELYPAPLPTPPLAGRTYVTYQPLYPHEFMYKHHRSYHSYYDGGKGLNRTLVSYDYNPIAVTVKGIFHKLRIPR
jgi:hypothetical protein